MAYSAKQHAPIFVALASVFFIVGTIIIKEQPWKHIGESGVDTQTTQQQLKLFAKEARQEVDSDKDGLPDWQERLYGSDINKTDTDEDGTSDGDEVFARRDPIKKGPNDRLAILEDKNATTSGTSIDSIRRDYIINTLLKNLQKSDEETVRGLVDSLDPNLFRKKYEVVNLKVISESGTASMKTYGNTFGVLIIKYTTLPHRSEEDILNDAFKNKSSATLKELQYPAITYRSFAEDLRALKVPIPLAEAHLRIVNGYDIMSRAVLNMQKLYSDPVLGSAAYQAYMKQRVEVTRGYAELVYYFSEHNIEFGKDEPGAPFTWPPAALATSTTK